MAKRVRDLQCWQLADSLRKEVCAICAKEDVARSLRFCDGFTEAAGSVCRNITEGFARFDSRQIVQFFNYALGSLAEVQDYLSECVTRNFIDQAQFGELSNLAEHTRAVTLKFSLYHQKKLRTRRRSNQAARRT
jgi:four helix bundle protein